jgi:hypothetical protein
MQVARRQTKDNFENGQEYARLTNNPHCNLMLDRRVLRTEGRFARHRSFLPQKVVHVGMD